VHDRRLGFLVQHPYEERQTVRPRSVRVDERLLRWLRLREGNPEPNDAGLLRCRLRDEERVLDGLLRAALRIGLGVRYARSLLSLDPLLTSSERRSPSLRRPPSRRD
jgi:hypothetical protein